VKPACDLRRRLVILVVKLRRTGISFSPQSD
jgi:hypothetical protein